MTSLLLSGFILTDRDHVCFVRVSLGDDRIACSMVESMIDLGCAVWGGGLTNGSRFIRLRIARRSNALYSTTIRLWWSGKNTGSCGLERVMGTRSHQSTLDCKLQRIIVLVVSNKVTRHMYFTPIYQYLSTVLEVLDIASFVLSCRVLPAMSS
jgi:hypothetical protein